MYKRQVQGGDKFKESVIVDKSVEDGIEELCGLAPVHNAGHLKGIRAVDSLMPVSYTHLDVYKRQLVSSRAVTQLSVPRQS